MTPLAIRMADAIVGSLLSLVLIAFPGATVAEDIRDQQWYLDFLHVDEAHELATGVGVTVAVIDTGVDGSHPDLAGRVLPGADFSVVHGPDAWEDREGHGTAMVGLIAAHGQALGIAPDATILPVRRAVYHSGVDIGAAESINWAVDQGATVLCLAFAGPQPFTELQDAIERAIAHDVVVVAGIGNVPASSRQYPAAYPGVVGAAGVDRNGNHASISVVSPAAVLAAPAVDITSTGARNVSPSGYRTGTGTSDATAIIAGVAALVRARFPDLSAQEVIHRMTATAVDRGPPGRDDEYGYGIVNPVAALTADVPPITTTTPQSPVESGDGTTSRTVIIASTALVLGVLIVVSLVIALRRRR